MCIASSWPSRCRVRPGRNWRAPSAPPEGDQALQIVDGGAHCGRDLDPQLSTTSHSSESMLVLTLDEDVLASDAELATGGVAPRVSIARSRLRAVASFHLWSRSRFRPRSKVRRCQLGNCSVASPASRGICGFIPPSMIAETKSPAPYPLSPVRIAGGLTKRHFFTQCEDFVKHRQRPVPLCCSRRGAYPTAQDD